MAEMSDLFFNVNVTEALEKLDLYHLQVLLDEVSKVLERRLSTYEG